MYERQNAASDSYVFAQPIAEQIWQDKYKYTTAAGNVDRALGDTFHRVANGLAAIEPEKSRQLVAQEFYHAMQDFRLIPAGRILSGCGTERSVTLSNTFVMRTIPDSVDGIMDTIKDAAKTMQMGGGIGFDFSTLRPRGWTVKGLDCPAAGPLAAMDICDAVCKMLVTGMGRGAMMATMRCDHPDIMDFITAKSDRTRLRNFNVSVMITDDFIDAVSKDDEWDLMWDGQIVRTVNAMDLWDAIMRQTYDTAEPGVLFIDRINEANPLNYLETISATNSCAEQPLPPNGTCPLAAINLAQLVLSPFTPEARLDLITLRRMVGTAVRMLDNTLDISHYANDAQRHEALSKRRIGIGVTGVADAIIMLGAVYGSAKAVFLVGSWMQAIQNAAYLASAELARERGAFPSYNAKAHMAQPTIQALDPEVGAAVAAYGLRNGTLTTIAPTGTTSMFAGNTSSGIEPVFANAYTRTITRPDGRKEDEHVMDYAVWLYRQMHGPDAPLTDAFVTVADLEPRDHVRMQAAAQRWVDSGISKTVNCPADIPFDTFKNVYLEAYASGCKGCTTYRPNDVTGSVLTA
ncbi:adenosylcobalamin-dependent ribonucleoside-diphosphate reductase [Yoonia sp. R2331]|uniref:adenosylcobalamin-dependent ribonucleoside-diphosphate reductase n=1 Tax=Yoonia sp. R2331 TaxID=3237238 RepID=UPI0034E4F6B8